MKQLLDVENVKHVTFTAVSFIDGIVGLGEKRIAVDAKHLERIDVNEDRIELVIHRKSLNDYREERNKILWAREDDAEFDHLNSMLAMLEHDFFSIDRIKLFYRDADNLSGEYVVDTSNDEIVEMISVINNNELNLTVQLI